MAADVDICNLALGHLGDVATVASINPPSGDAQSSHCARFFPICLAAMVERHTWGWSTTRTAMALLSVNPGAAAWAYAYSPPSNVVNYIEVLDPTAVDEYSVGIQMAGVGAYSAPVVGLGIYIPQAFEVETDSSGNDVVFTNLQNAMLRYTFLPTDISKLNPLSVLALSHLLASKLAGPVIKGDEGRKASADQLKMYEATLIQAIGSDANQRRVRPAQGATWMINR